MLKVERTFYSNLGQPTTLSLANITFLNVCVGGKEDDIWSIYRLFVFGLCMLIIMAMSVIVNALLLFLS